MTPVKDRWDLLQEWHVDRNISVCRCPWRFGNVYFLSQHILLLMADICRYSASGVEQGSGKGLYMKLFLQFITPSTLETHSLACMRVTMQSQYLRGNSKKSYLRPTSMSHLWLGLVYLSKACSQANINVQKPFKCPVHIINGFSIVCYTIHEWCLGVRVL